MVLVLAIFGLLVASIMFAYAYKFFGLKAEDAAPAAPDAPQPERARGGGRLRARAQQRRQQVAESDGDSEDESDEEDEGDVAGDTRQARVAARRRQRQRNRDEQRDAAQAQREAREAKTNAYEERQKQKEAEREERERLEEEERLRKAEERRKLEDEEAEKWKGFISVDETGELESEQQTEALLEKFVGAIKDRKMSVLEDLAAEFQMRTQEVIQRIEQLETMGRITGVMDDRGKYIYISREEMSKVADFIKSRGRVRIAELAHKSNQLVDLEAKASASDLPDIDLSEFVDDS